MKKILIIEDDQIVRSNIEEFLFEAGYEVQSAENGSKGIQLASQLLPDLIICDVMMPGKNGYEVIRELSEQPGTASIPFIFLTAKAEVSDIRYGMQLGADDYLIKPFTSSELFKSIEIRLNKRKLIERNKSSSLSGGSSQDKKVLGYDSHIFLLSGNKPEIIKINSIKYITAQSEYSQVFCSDKRKLLVRRLLKEWEAILPSSHFLRINRSTIINLTQINKIDKWFNHSFRVQISDDLESFIISRRFSSKLRAQIKTDM